MNSRRRGNTLIEFTLVGIPVMFTLISIFEIAFGMWIYHTLDYGVREATRFLAVKGSNCATPPNSCSVTVAQIAQRIQFSAFGLLPNQLNVILRSSNGGSPPVTCAPLSSCFANNAIWPTGAGSIPLPGNDLVVTATYPFRPMILMLWPGAGGASFGAFTFTATSQEPVKF